MTTDAKTIAIDMLSIVRGADVVTCDAVSELAAAVDAILAGRRLGPGYYDASVIVGRGVWADYDEDGVSVCMGAHVGPPHRWRIKRAI